MDKPSRPPYTRAPRRLFSRAGGTYAGRIPEGQSGRWEVPAAWLAEGRDGRVAMWRVYTDNLAIRRLMGLERE